MTTVAKNLRLTPRECDGIRQAVMQACAETGAVWRSIVLFGSRADPGRRGGDIDLLIVLDPAHPADVYRLTQRLRIAMEDRLGEQHVDLVVDDGRGGQAIHAIARQTGVELWSNT